LTFDSLYICPPYLYTVATLPWQIQKSHFQQLHVFHIYFRLFALSEKKTSIHVRWANVQAFDFKFSRDLQKKKLLKSVNF